MKIGIIGYGSMGKMLLWKFAEEGNIPKESLFAANRTREKLDEARDIATISDNRELAQNAEIIFLCIRPSDMKTVLDEIRTAVRPEALIVSLNGSISFRSLHKIIQNRSAKVIPSLTAEIGRSQTLVCYDPSVTAEDKTALSVLLQCLGDVIELPEHEMGMGSELVSCMPGFIASIFDVICSAAQAHTSISKEQIVRMVLGAMSATGDLMLRNQMPFEAIVQRVATKGGITEVGTSVIYEQFSQTARQLFEKTLEKRHLTAETAEKIFENHTES